VARATGAIQEIIEGYDPTMDSGFGFLAKKKRRTLSGIRSSERAFHPDRVLWQ
jgi:hypothetical protein